MFLTAPGALGPCASNRGDHAVLGAATDNVLPGTVPAVPIRQRPHPTHGHGGATRPPAELQAVLGAAERTGARVLMTPQDPQFREVP